MQSTFEEIRAQAKAERCRIVPILKAKYGEFDERDWREVQSADEELAQCAGCEGQCLKTHSRWVKPVIRNENGTIVVNAALCRYARHNQIKSGCRLAKIPPKYVGKTFADYVQTADNREGLQIAKWLVSEKPDKGAYFYGGVGTGKTLLAAIVAQEFIGDGNRVIFGDVPSLLVDIKSTFDGKTSTAAFVEELLDADLLVLDDIGAEKITDWSAEQVYLLINGRYNAAKPTVVTSNYDFEALVARYGGDIIAQRFISRLRETTAQAFFGTKDWRN